VHPEAVIALAFGPDGKTLLTCSEGTDRTLRRWDPATGKLLGSQTLYRGEENWSASFSPDGRTLLTREPDHARLWDAATGKPVGRPLRGIGETLLWFERSVEVFSPEGHLVLTAGPDASARLWHVATGEPFGAPLKPPGPVHATAFLADGNVILLGGEDESGQRGEAWLWETATGQPVGPPLTHRRSVTAVAFSPDGRVALTGSCDGTARLWDAATGKPLHPPLVHRSPVLIVAFSPDGKTALTATESLAATEGLTAQLWDVGTGKALGPAFPCDSGSPTDLTTAAFRPDVKALLTATLQRAHLWAVPAPLAGEPERLRLWVEVCTGLELDASGAVVELDAAAWRQRRERPRR
jgi:WD40 repeat protein